MTIGPLTERQKQHVETHRDEYHRKYARWIMRRFLLDRDEAHSVVDMGMVKAARRWAPGMDLGPLVFLRSRSEALKARLQRLPLHVSLYAERIKRAGFDQPWTCELDDDDGPLSGDVQALDDMEWLAWACESLTKRQRRSLYSRKHNTAVHRGAIAALRGKAAELLA